jgi:hypothetical protein
MLATYSKNDHYGVWHHVVWHIDTNISGEPAASIFKVEDSSTLKVEAADFSKMMVVIY